MIFCLSVPAINKITELGTPESSRGIGCACPQCHTGATVECSESGLRSQCVKAFLTKINESFKKQASKQASDFFGTHENIHQFLLGSAAMFESL